MYIKRNPYSFRRRRRRSSFLRVLILLLLIGAGIYLLFRLSSGPASVPMFNTPTLMPTPTKSAVSYAAEAQDYYRAGLLSEAIVSYRSSLDLEPEQPDLYVELARVLIFSGRPEQGLDMTREALRREPENAWGWAVQCLAYDWLGMAQEAIGVCERAIRLDPTLPEAYAYLAEAYIDVGNWFGANDAIDTALQLDEQNVDVLRNYGYVLEVQGNYTSAIEAYREAVSNHAALVHVYLSMARNYQALGNISRAVEMYEAAAASDPSNPAPLDQLAAFYLLQGDYAEAQEYLNRALEIEPHHPRALGHLGILYFQRRNYEDAIPTLENAVRYGEAESRQEAVRFYVTLESVGQIGVEATGEKVAQALFVHPDDITYPMRAVVSGEEEGSSVEGRVRLSPLDGRYVLNIEGLPPAPPTQVYVGWFEPLFTPEGGMVRVELTPDGAGQVSIKGSTGPVEGPPIEHYYILALCHYFLDQCDQALPYVRVALRIDPNDANALETLHLCNE
jgi:tetratricopeptide (TPR) repeat protein